ncbi:hypothetical protein [Pseudomonas aeruginosa]
MERILRFADRVYKAFEEVVSPGDDLGLRKFYYLLLAALLVVVVVLLLDVGLSLFGVSTHGTFGDFFGGVANPLLTFLTFFGLLITIVLQKEELRETRKELARSAGALDEQVEQFKRQANVSAFYKLLDNHVSLVGSIDLVNTEGVRTVGRDCLRVYRNRLTKVFRSGVRWDNDNLVLQKMMKPVATSPAAIRQMFQLFWQEEGEDLQPYMAYVRITLSYLESHLDFDDQFVAMYRALFTHSELMLIFYYALVVDDEDFSRQLSVTGFCIDLHDSFLLASEHRDWLSECRIPQN